MQLKKKPQVSSGSLLWTVGKAIAVYMVVALLSVTTPLYAQTHVFAQLQGAPVDLTGWNLQGIARIANIKSNNNSEILLAPAQFFQSGSIFYNRPIDLSVCNKWAAEFDFRIFDGTMADGIAFCFLDVPPTGFVNGGGLGVPVSANGLKVCFDPNPNCQPFDASFYPKIELRWGIGYDECANQPTLKNNNGNLSFIRSDGYNHAKITYDSGNISVYLNDQLYLTGFQQFNFSGYMGFTASTGGRTDNHSIKNVTIYTDMPPSVAGTSQEICSGSSAQLGTTPNSNYTYAWSPATGLSASNIANPLVTLINTTGSKIVQKYTVLTSFNNNTGCASLDQVEVTVDPLPTVNIAATATTICQGTPVTLTATANATGNNINYTWFKNGVATGDITAQITVNNITNNDWFQCTRTSLNCVAASNTIPITVNPILIPSINISAPALTICPGDPIIFSATAVNPGVNPGYQWKVNNVNAGTNSDTFAAGNLNNNDVISCTFISNATCAAPATVVSNSLTVTVNTIQTPQANITATAASICNGSPDTFSINLLNATALSYQWKVNGVNVGINSTYGASNFADQDKITCDLIVKTPCSPAINLLAGSFTINVKPKISPTVSIEASSLGICIGTPVRFTAITTNEGASPVYQWKVNNVNVGANSATFTSSQLQDKDVVSCELSPQNVDCLVQPTQVSNSLTMRVFDLPVVSLPATLSVTEGDAVSLSPTVTGNIISYNWAPVSGLNNPSIKNPIASPSFNTSYTLLVTGAGGCTATATIQVLLIHKKIMVHNTFTPNGDGINDTWLIDDLINYPACTVDIFNRYGEKLFHSVGYRTPWDGLYKNSPLPVGVYYYLIDLKNGTPLLSGYVTVLR